MSDVGVGLNNLFRFKNNKTKPEYRKSEPLKPKGYVPILREPVINDDITVEEIALFKSTVVDIMRKAKTMRHAIIEDLDTAHHNLSDAVFKALIDTHRKNLKGKE